MHVIVEEEVDKLESGFPLSAMEWRGVMDRSFRRMDEEVVDPEGAAGKRRNVSCRCELQTPKCEHVGSAAIVAVVGPERIVVANCGDSRAVLCRRGEVLPLSVDHKVGCVTLLLGLKYYIAISRVRFRTNESAFTGA